MEHLIYKDPILKCNKINTAIIHLINIYYHEKRNLYLTNCFTCSFFMRWQWRYIQNPDNSKKDQVLTLSKYPQKVIDIETGSKEHLALLNATTRSTFLIKDSVWPDKKGHSLIYETNEHGTTANTMRYIYLGSLLKGGSLEEQQFSRLNNELDPLYISYSFPAKIVGDIIEKPSLQSQRTSLSKIMNARKGDSKQIVSFIYDPWISSPYYKK